MRWKHEELPTTTAPIYAPEIPKSPLIQETVQVLDKPIKLGSYIITSIPTHHSKLVKSQGYLIQKGNTSLLYKVCMCFLDTMECN